MGLARLAIASAVAVGTAAAQPAARETAPGFEVASVKPASPTVGLPRFYGDPGTADPGRIAWESIHLRQLLMKAYAVESDQISGPGWIESEKYAVMATIPPGLRRNSFGSCCSVYSRSGSGLRSTRKRGIYRPMS